MEASRRIFRELSRIEDKVYILFNDYKSSLTSTGWKRMSRTRKSSSLKIRRSAILHHWNNGSNCRILIQQNSEFCRFICVVDENE